MYGICCKNTVEVLVFIKKLEDRWFVKVYEKITVITLPAN
jgi:hypothetical protein